jgi:hypothetical protein
MASPGTYPPNRAKAKSGLTPLREQGADVHKAATQRFQLDGTALLGE